jgi:hypothetical protein
MRVLGVVASSRCGGGCQGVHQHWRLIVWMCEQGRLKTTGDQCPIDDL